MVRYQCRACNNIQESTGPCQHCSAMRSQLEMAQKFANSSANVNKALYGDMSTQCRTWGPLFYFVFAIVLLVMGCQANSPATIVVGVFAIILPPIFLVVRRKVFLKQPILPGDVLPCFFFCNPQPATKPPAKPAEPATETTNPVV